MGKITGKPGPDPRSPAEKKALQPIPGGPSFGGPHRPATKEVMERDKSAEKRK